MSTLNRPISQSDLLSGISESPVTNHQIHNSRRQNRQIHPQSDEGEEFFGEIYSIYENTPTAIKPNTQTEKNH